MPIRQSNSGTTTASSSFTVTLPSATLGSSRIVVAIGGNTVVNTPSGWTSRSPQVNTMGHYVMDRAGDAGSSWGFTTTTSGHLSWHVFEVEGGAFDVSNGSNRGGGGAVLYTTASATPTSGDRVLIGTLASVDTTASPTYSGWTDSFTEAFDTGTSATNEFIGVGTATREVTANGSTAYSTGATVSRSHFAASNIFAAYSTASASTPPTVGAGADADHVLNTQFSRTATENDNGSTITARAWTVQSGPAQVGATLSTAAAVTWTPGTAGAYVLRYSATNAGGTTTDDATITVTADQLVAPNADVTVTGWTFTGGASANAVLAGATANDATYASSPAGPSSSVLEVGFADPAVPQARTGHTVQYRVRTAAATSTVVAGLYQGTTLIASETRNNVPAGFTTYTLTVTEGEAQAITDYADLRLRLTVTAA